jgi:exportin-1
LRAINQNCFPALLGMPPNVFRLILDSVIWAFKHTMRDIADTGLQICLELLNNVAKLDRQAASLFYQSYYILMFQDVFYVLTDREHKSGFKYQAQILAQLCTVVDSGLITGPLSESTGGLSNEQFIREYLIQLMQSAFPNMQPHQTKVFVSGLFDLKQDMTLFKQHLRDFLVQLKEFSGADDGNAELFLEEKESEMAERRRRELESAMRVPGLLKPSEREDDMED